MDAPTFRPRIDGLEERLTPFAPADVYNSIAQVTFMSHLMQDLAASRGEPRGVTTLIPISTALQTGVNQSAASAAVMGQFAADIQAAAAANPAAAGVLEQFVPMAVQLEGQATQNGVYGQYWATWVAQGITNQGGTVPVVPPPANPLPPASPPATTTPAVAQDDSGMTDTIPDANSSQFQAQADGLKIWDVQQGTGDTVQAGSSIKVFYTGWLVSTGAVFDSDRANLAPSGNGGTPTTFDLTGLIKGFQEGIPGMKVGGIRRLYVPAALGYGSAGSPPSIPANADLIFEVKVLGTTPATTSTATPGG